MSRVILSDENGWLPSVQVNGESTNLASWMASVEDRLTATSPASSALMTGPASKQSASSTGTLVALTVSQEETLKHLTAAIMACIKSTPSMPPAWDMTWDGSSILLRMSPSPTPSGLSEAGNPGHAVPEISHITGQAGEYVQREKRNEHR